MEGAKVKWFNRVSIQDSLVNGKHRNKNVKCKTKPKTKAKMKQREIMHAFMAAKGERSILGSIF